MKALVRRGREERGAALIEMAMSLPLLLLVCVGILEFGRAYQAWQVVTNAAREGARVAVLPGTTDTAVEDRVKAYLDAGALGKSAYATIAINRNNNIPIGAGTASASSVTVTYPFDFMVLQPLAQMVSSNSTVGGSINMMASATMRNE